MKRATQCLVLVATFVLCLSGAVAQDDRVPSSGGTPHADLNPSHPPVVTPEPLTIAAILAGAATVGGLVYRSRRNRDAE